MPKSFEIWRVQYKLKQSMDRRPAIVITVTLNTTCEVMLLSSALDLYNPKRDFLIPDTAPEFLATGLKRSSYVYGGTAAELESHNLEKRYGELQGQLLANFKRWLQA